MEADEHCHIRSTERRGGVHVSALRRVLSALRRVLAALPFSPAAEPQAALADARDSAAAALEWAENLMEYLDMLPDGYDRVHRAAWALVEAAREADEALGEAVEAAEGRGGVHVSALRRVLAALPFSPAWEATTEPPAALADARDPAATALEWAENLVNYLDVLPDGYDRVHRTAWALVVAAREADEALGEAVEAAEDRVTDLLDEVLARAAGRAPPE